MIATIATIFVAYWIYQSSMAVKTNPWGWICSSVVIFYVSMHIWSSYILKPIFGRQFYEHSMSTALVIEVTSVLFGLAIIALIRFRLIKKSDI